MKEKLALLGGTPVLPEDFPPYNSIGREEENAAVRVIRSGALSAFYGSNHPNFYGGPEVKALEREWADYFKMPHAVSVNSATSGLYAAIGALGIGPGDEVIVPPYTMCASVTSVLIFNAIPVFADIEDQTFCLDPASVEKLITPRTKAIVVVHLFGHMARMDEIMAIAKRYGLKIIEDCAQAPGAHDNGRFAGTMGDIGVYSLNCHKTINTGEGGVCVCSDDEIYKRLLLIRNHAEAVISGGFQVQSLANMLGYNFRMGEIEAAMAREQLKKLDRLNDARNDLAVYLSDNLRSLKGIIVPSIRKNCKHVWYIYPLRVDSNALGVPRNLFVKALAKEGVPFYPGYVQPLYLMPVFQQRTAYGKDGCPFTCERNRTSAMQYERGTCQTCERVEELELIGSECIRPPATRDHMDKVVTGFKKVIDNLDELKALSHEELVLPADPAARRKMFRKK